ncbi:MULTISPECIES: hypothetical protein [Gilliamella]|uniref:hypothetical protein n=1 Tax=Gilliamella TaxID=1193503 RepID=UPI00080E9E2E|nr:MULTISPECIES: hypothetical protein [Gilliamella]MCO6548886.1 hypothetical protein [Gilliamella sp.]OCG34242.1 hypothetical protein A9G32_10045 [Gilliamella apicola]OCG45465.1 hypothetical protein A9G35_06320 [Gilliamella apicola]OCG50014.1 hypothetical protein A9G26_07370 [Gilliamella apicola]OCG52036.1 hypothetical protein A9G27_10775 [Gilliamella apicola]
MFRSSSVLRHLLRGCIGFGLLGLTIYLFIQGAVWSVLLGLVSAVLGFVVLRGCPACWVIGLIMTITNPGKTCIPCTKKDESISTDLK